MTFSSESKKISLKARLRDLDSAASKSEIKLYGDIECETAKSLPACKVVPGEYVHLENRMRYTAMCIQGI